MSFKDISGLVEQNVDLRHLVHRLTCEDEKKEEELKVSIKFLCKHILVSSFSCVFLAILNVYRLICLKLEKSLTYLII